MSDEATREAVRFRDYGHVFTCERCRAQTNGLFHDDPSDALRVMGWHNVGGNRWVCSRSCLEWLRVMAATPQAQPVQASDQVNDRAYQARRKILEQSGLVPPPKR